MKEAVLIDPVIRCPGAKQRVMASNIYLSRKGINIVSYHEILKKKN
jgi:hypothetical protein